LCELSRLQEPESKHKSVAMNSIMTDTTIESLLRRIAEGLERITPPPPDKDDLGEANAFVWRAESTRLEPVQTVNAIDLNLLKGIDRVRDILLENSRRFADGLPANNALLWGARGMGKSSLVKAVHAELAADYAALTLVEIHREDTPTLPPLLTRLAALPQRFIIFCDDLSFDDHDTSYKSLKAVLEGGLEGRPDNVLFYATSNRRHLMPRDMIENERSTAINPAEAVDEKVSLSDRFGLWLGFHGCNQDIYLDIIAGYAEHYGLQCDADEMRAQAIEWSITRGARSGRVAWQFVQDLAGNLGVKL